MQVAVNKWQIVVAVIALLILASSVIWGKAFLLDREDGGKDSVLASIDNLVKQTDDEQEYQMRVLLNGYFVAKGSVTDRGQELGGYYKDDKLYKISHSVGLSYGLINLVYYFNDGKLIFVHEEERVSPHSDGTEEEPDLTVTTTYEGRYYFIDEKLTEIRTIGSKRFSTSTDRDRIASFPQNAKELIGLLSEIEPRKATGTPISWKSFSYPRFQVPFPEKPYVTPENATPETKVVTYRAGQEDGTQYFITVTDLSPEPNEVTVSDNSVLKSSVWPTAMNLGGSLISMADTDQQTGADSIDFKVHIPDGPRTYMARHVVKDHIFYELRVISTDRSFANAHYQEFFNSFKILPLEGAVNQTATVPTAKEAKPVQQMSITPAKPLKEEWGGIQIQLRSTPFDMRILWEPWMDNPEIYDQQLTELEIAQKTAQSENEAKWKAIIDSTEVTNQFIPYTEDQIKKLSENINGLKAERKGKQDLIDMIPSNTFVFQGKVFEGKIVEDLKENFRMTVGVLDDVIGLLETQTGVKYGTIKKVQNKDVVGAVNSANDEDTLSLVIAWHWAGYEKLSKQGQTIYKQLQLEAAQ